MILTSILNNSLLILTFIIAFAMGIFSVILILAYKNHKQINQHPLQFLLPKDAPILQGDPTEKELILSQEQQQIHQAIRHLKKAKVLMQDSKISFLYQSISHIDTALMIIEPKCFKASSIKELTFFINNQKISK